MTKCVVWHALKRSLALWDMWDGLELTYGSRGVKGASGRQAEALHAA